MQKTITTTYQIELNEILEKFKLKGKDLKVFYEDGNKRLHITLEATKEEKKALFDL